MTIPIYLANVVPAVEAAKLVLETKGAMPVNAGFGWTAAGAWGTFISTFIAMLWFVMGKVGPWRKQTTDASDALIRQLTEQLAAAVKRIDKVERQLDNERKMNYIEKARTNARHTAQQALQRHKFVNTDANLDALLRILEVSPEKAPEAARQAREARAAQRQNEQIEAAEIYKAEMLAVELAERELAEQDGPSDGDDK